MIKANQDIRNKVKQNNIKYWQVALKYGVNDVTFTKKLRVELSLKEKEKINCIIDELIREQKED